MARDRELTELGAQSKHLRHDNSADWSDDSGGNQPAKPADTVPRDPNEDSLKTPPVAPLPSLSLPLRDPMAHAIASEKQSSPPVKTDATDRDTHQALPDSSAQKLSEAHHNRPAPLLAQMAESSIAVTQVVNPHIAAPVFVPSTPLPVNALPAGLSEAMSAAQVVLQNAMVSTAGVATPTPASLTPIPDTIAANLGKLLQALDIKSLFSSSAAPPALPQPPPPPPPPAIEDLCFRNQAPGSFWYFTF